MREYEGSLSRIICLGGLWFPHWSHLIWKHASASVSAKPELRSQVQDYRREEPDMGTIAADGPPPSENGTWWLHRQLPTSACSLYFHGTNFVGQCKTAVIQIFSYLATPFVLYTIIDQSCVCSRRALRRIRDFIFQRWNTTAFFTLPRLESSVAEMCYSPTISRYVGVEYFPLWNKRR